MNHDPSDVEMELRTRWDRQGVPLDVQDQLIGGIVTRAQAAPVALVPDDTQ